MSLTSLILKFAAPVPKPESYSRFLFVGPHPDDVEIGAGATAAKLARAGKQVTILVCLDGRYGDGLSGGVRGDDLARTRREEAVRAAARLGVKDVLFLGRLDGGVKAVTPEEAAEAEMLCDGGFYEMKDLVQGLADAVTRTQPEVIFGPDPLSRSECHPDHLNTGNAVRQIACFSPYPGIMSRYPAKAPEDGKAGAPVQAAAFYMTARPNRYIRTDGALLKAQLEAIAAHRSQFPAGSAELKSVSTYLRLRSFNFGLHRAGLHGEGFRVYGQTQMHCLPEAGE